jgi:hypothetical protein
MKLKDLLREREQLMTIDSIAMDIPLFLRALEFAREDAMDDIDLHKFTENAQVLMKTKSMLTMDDYKALISGTNTK